LTTDAASGLPKLDEINRFFWTSGSDGVLRILRCDSCSHWLHPPNLLCPKCGSEALTPTPTSGRATVATFTVNHQPWAPGLEVPYTLAIVELDDLPGVRLTTKMVNHAEPVWIGQPVKVVFEHREDVWLPMFEPA
jgi:uncharacterized OB-fold protein